MIKNDLSVEILFALLLLGMSGSALGFFSEIMFQDYARGTRAMSAEAGFALIILFTFGSFGILTGFGLIYKKRRWVKTGQIALFLCSLGIGVFLIDNLGEFVNDTFILMSLLCAYFGISAFILFTLGNSRLFPWLLPSNKKEEQP